MRSTSWLAQASWNAGPSARMVRSSPGWHSPLVGRAGGLGRPDARRRRSCRRGTGDRQRRLSQTLDVRADRAHQPFDDDAPFVPGRERGIAPGAGRRIRSASPLPSRQLKWRAHRRVVVWLRAAACSRPTGRCRASLKFRSRRRGCRPAAAACLAWQPGGHASRCSAAGSRPTPAASRRRPAPERRNRRCSARRTVVARCARGCARRPPSGPARWSTTARWSRGTRRIAGK